MRHRLALVLLGVGLALSGCAGTPGPDNDPFEATNRAVFAFNLKLDDAVLLPVAKTYVRIVPTPVRSSVHDALANLDAPVIFANDLLQGDLSLAGDTLGRFAVNSTLGLGGLFDIASNFGIPAHGNDFGLTLGRWGLGQGPYLMLPLLGPAPPRDLVGDVADILLDPTTYFSSREILYLDAGRSVFGIVDWRSRHLDLISNIKRTSVDPYATTRSLYLQQRAAEVHQGDGTAEDLPAF